MTDQPHENLPEIRFNPNRGYYQAALLIFLVGIGFLSFFSVFEIIALTDHPSVQVGLRHYRIGIFTELRAAILGGGGGLAALGTIALVAVTLYRNRRDWRQLRKPEVVVDADGVRFEARRRVVSVPWTDIEQLVLRRRIYTSRTASFLRIRVSSDSEPRRAMLLPHSPRGWYLIGELEKQANVPYDDAVRILDRFSGSRLEVIERDSRYKKS